jgi:hypothetical protein
MYPQKMMSRMDFLEYVLSRKVHADKAFGDLWIKRGVA